MNYSTETITPEKARMYLNTSKGNRPISKSTVLSYANTMKEGNWLLNGESIIFDKDGSLVNGHHRLHAVIASGIPVMFTICRGVEPESFTTYDCGRHRTFSQLLAMNGRKNCALTSSIVNANTVLEKYGRFTENIFAHATSQGNIKTTNKDKFEQYLLDPDGFDHVANILNRLKDRCNIMSMSWAGGLYYYLTHTGGYSEDVVYTFFEAVFSVNTSSIKVVDMLRQKLTQEKMSGHKLKAELLWALVAKTWNYYIDNITPKILRFQRNEELPKLKLRK